MRAAVLREAPGRVAVEELEVPSPGPQEIVVRTAAAGVCHSDLHVVEGTFPARLPLVLGHESAGVVAAVGSDVREVAVGDHVVTCPSAFCGHCDHCLNGRPYLCIAPDTHRFGVRPYATSGGEQVGQFIGLGSFAEQMVVHQRAAVRISRDLPLELAATLGCAVVTGVGAVLNTAQVPAGSSVAVIGCGGVGLNCVQGARLAGAARIVAIDRQPEKLELARRFGATEVIDASTTDAVEAVRAVAGGVEFSFEAIGRADTVAQAVAMLRPGGVATLIGVLPTGAEVAIPADELTLRGKRLQGSVMGSNRFRIDLPRYAELHLQGRLDLAGLVSDRLGLDDIDVAMDRLRDGNGARNLVVFQ